MSPEDSNRDWPSELRLDDEPGPAALVARSKVDDMIFGALDQVGFEETVEERISGVDRSSFAPKPGLGVRSLAAAAVLALLSIGSASAAVMWFGHASHDQPGAAKKAAAVVHARATPPGLRPEPAASDDPHEHAVAEELGAMPQRSAARAPEDWLVEGNRLRAEQRWNKADDAYARAAKDAPHSQTAYVARVAGAAVRLEHLHDPRGALSSYRTALQQTPHGALTEEIHWGIAEAYRALGERAAERRALTVFVREHPSSPLLSQARARLD
ncbi:MAG: hypothetical protein JWN04_5602 [Myxococcaceae bacterium]|nr:hypothetical protein [Myxococcaceae bacterium]